MKKILLDTDIGSDIDDSLALTYLLKQEKCEIVGITTVSGESEKRAMMADAIVKYIGKDIPIHTGLENPFLGESKQPKAQQAVQLCKWEHGKKFENDAVFFMRKIIHENPGEITLLAIGPLTNVAVLFLADTEIPKLLKELVIMGGRFGNEIAGLGTTEWNMICDPYAAQIVFSSEASIRAVGLDVTMQLMFSKKDMEKKLRAEVFKPVIDFADVWFKDYQSMVFHDPLAAAVIFDEELCKFETGRISVELDSDRLRGFTYFDKNPEGKHKIAIAVNKERFYKEYFSVTDKSNSAYRKEILL